MSSIRQLLVRKESALDHLADQGSDAVVTLSGPIQQSFDFNAIAKTHWTTSPINNQSLGQIPGELATIFGKQLL